MLPWSAQHDRHNNHHHFHYNHHHHHCHHFQDIFHLLLIMSLRSPHDWFFCWLIHDFVSLLSKISDNLNFLFLTSDDCFNMRNIYCLPGSVLARRCKLSSMVWAAVWTWPCALKHYFDIFFADICRCKRSNRLESWEENNHTQHRGGEKVEVALRHIFLNRSHLQRQCHYIYAKTKCH